MAENTLPADPHPPPPQDGVNRSKFHCFRTWSVCLTRITLAATRYQIFYLKTHLPLDHPAPPDLEQHVSKYFARRPPSPTHPLTHPPDPRDGVNWSKFHFFRTWSCYISNLRESRLQQHGAEYFACIPWFTPKLCFLSISWEGIDIFIKFNIDKI